MIDHLNPSLGRCAVVGAGRLGTALTRALPALEGPFGRGFDGEGYDLVLLAVGDGEISRAAAAIPPRKGLLVGHTSGATPLSALGGHEAFGVHPLMTVPDGAASLAGAGAAIAGSTPWALAAAAELADALGLAPAIEISDRHRAAYHAAASMASNYLVALEAAAEGLMNTSGGTRAMLVPLVRATVENWARLGAGALTGPIARGDVATVAAQRAAVAERTPAHLPLFDALADATRALATEAAA